MGMSREEMADMLMEQQALQTLGVANMDAVKEQYEIARKQGKEAEFLKKLGNDELASQLKSQSVQERVAAAQEKLVSAFEKLSPIIEAIVTPIADFAGFLASSKPLMDAIVKGALLLAGIKFANFLGLTKSLGGIGGAVSGGGAGGAVMKETGKKVYGAAAQSAMKAGTATAAKSGGGFLGGLLSKVNPLNFVKGKLGSVAGKLLKIPLISSVLETIFAGQDIAALISSGGSLNDIYKGIGVRGGEAIGGIGGAALGAAVGSVIPGPGTLIGGILGDALGRWVGSSLTEALGAEGFGKTIASTFGYDKDIEKGIKGGQIQAEDYVIKTLPQDTVVGAGGTKLGRTDEMVALLQELITVVKQGGNVYLDGSKVGTAMGVSAYKTQ
jgi:hypothetical protein